MAPEQCDPPRAGVPGSASEVFELGVTLFEVVAGYRPFDDGDAGAADPTLRFPQLMGEPYSLPERVADDVAKVIHACLERDPADRPLPHELVEGLEPALERCPRGRLAGFNVR